jgi:dolichol-phosphate mannosyltransferase
VIREFASSGATTASRILFPRALGSVTDPMSGFFALRRSAVDPQVLHPRGFKILLEILTRAPHLSVGEVPFIFSARGAGESKAGLKEGTRLLRQLLDLRLATWGRWVRPAQFAVVGASGIGVNLAVLAALLALGIGSTIAGGEMLAAIASTQVALAWNCLVTERWVFPDRRRRPWSRPLFWALSNLTLGVQLLLAPALLPYTRGSYLLATGVAILALAAVRFVLCDRLLYAGRPAAPPVTAPAHDGIALVPPWTISVRQLVEPTTTGLTGERDLAAVLQ